ncbi:MAG: M28 family peptidase, partial [Chloroherpetonaceae bacterium]|nr:M28 family peptidase [Chloroherpetonaceae bacterium]
GRGSGDIGNDRAAQMIAGEFARCGLKPLGTRRQKDTTAPLDGSGYYQPFTIEGGRVAGRRSRLEVRFGDRTVNYRPGTEFEPSGISAGGAAEGEIVFVGYGISAPGVNHDDYAHSIDVKGKIVLLFEGAPGRPTEGPLANQGSIFRKAFTARNRGAIAVLSIRERASDTPSSGFDQRTDAGIPVLRVRYPMAERWLNAQGLKIEEVQRRADAGEFVSQPLNASARIYADVQKVSRTTANIVGMIEGSDPTLRDEYVIIGAHMDHLGFGGAGSMDRSGKPAIHYGADDNASGTTGVLQLAAWFGPKSGNGSPVRLKRSLVLICFSGEEMGLLGSVHYTRKPVVPLEKTVAMLNMDMIGRLRDNVLTIGGVTTAKEWPALLTEANQGVRLTLRDDAARPSDLFGASDHFPFYQREIPVLFFFTGLHADYHRPTDTADRINTAGMSRILQLVAEVTRLVADMPARPTFQRMQTGNTSRPSMRFRVSMGIMPEYSAGEEGVLLGGVRPGGPAERAGLKAGDLIVKLDDRTVRNIEEYMLALSEKNAGDRVQVTVRRGDQTLTLTVTLEAPARQ